MTRILTVVTTVLALALLAGCGLFFDSTQDTDPTDLGEGLADLEVEESLAVLDAGGDEEAFRTAFMKTFELERSGGIAARGIRPVLSPASRGASAKATVPVDLVSLVFSDTTGTIDNYPEPGLTTSYTVVKTDDLDELVYLITSTTTYPVESEIDTYVEQYYVLDVDPTGTWDEADPIVKPSGDTWEEDRTHREKMQVEFRDKSIRYETIVTMIRPDDLDLDGFAPFDITGPLTFPDFSYPDKDENAVYSSIVTYTHVRNQDHDFWFWSGAESQDIQGVRYYTEHYVNGNTEYKSTMVAYEKTVSHLETIGGSMVDQLDDIFIGSINTVLAESVVRKEVLFSVMSGSVVPEAVGQNTIMRTHVVDLSATEQADFEIQLLNDDVARTMEWSGAPYFIPQGEADEIVFENPELYEVLVKTEATNPDGAHLPLITTLDVGDSDLAMLYASLETGAFLTVEPSLDITGTVDEAGVILEFDGGQGTTVPAADIETVTTTGTVEAWVYIEKHTNWGGIVHKGVQADFTDESYSLQFWGKKGNVAFAVVEQDPGYKYAVAKSKTRLNTGQWYYLVGTWDADKVRIYINGVEDKSANNTLITKTAYVSDAPLVIGSQLADTEAQVLRGYYGTNGRINGVKISGTAKSAAEILQFYNANKDLTVNW